jgi:phosphoribosylformylglycinamidine synthase subunit PurL
LMEDYAQRLEQTFRDPGDYILLLGDPCTEIGGSEYLKTWHGFVRGLPPSVDLDRERRLHTVLLDLAGQHLLKSAHDCSDGGLAVTLAECGFLRDGSCLGAIVELPLGDRPDFQLFGEAHSRAVVTAVDTDAVERICTDHGVPCRMIGRVGGTRLVIERALDANLYTLRTAWENALK